MKWGGSSWGWVWLCRHSCNTERLHHRHRVSGGSTNGSPNLDDDLFQGIAGCNVRGLLPVRRPLTGESRPGPFGPGRLKLWMPLGKWNGPKGKVFALCLQNRKTRGRGTRKLTASAREESKTPLLTLRRIPSRFGAPAFLPPGCYAPAVPSIFVAPAQA